MNFFSIKMAATSPNSASIAFLSEISKQLVTVMKHLDLSYVKYSLVLKPLTRISLGIGFPIT